MFPAPSRQIFLAGCRDTITQRPQKDLPSVHRDLRWWFSDFHSVFPVCSIGAYGEDTVLSRDGNLDD